MTVSLTDDHVLTFLHFQVCAASVRTYSQPLTQSCLKEFKACHADYELLAKPALCDYDHRHHDFVLVSSSLSVSSLSLSSLLPLFVIDTLQVVLARAEALAKAQFAGSRDAHDCALMYVALKKKQLLLVRMLQQAF